MELNKYDLVEWLISNFGAIHCHFCPIRKECEEIERAMNQINFICYDKDTIKELLIKKYNL